MKRRITASDKIIHDFKLNNCANTMSSNKDLNMLSIYDWMMEASSLLKISKDAFYRSMILFQKCYEEDKKMVSQRKVEAYVCASLSLSAKIECSRINYLDAIYIVNARRTAK